MEMYLVVILCIISFSTAIIVYCLYLTCIRRINKYTHYSRPACIDNYIISLLRSQDRRQHIEKTFGYDKTIYDAIDGKVLAKEEPELITRYIKNRDTLSPGQIGCYLSHIFLWRDIVDKNISGKRYYIFEDDVVLKDQLPTNDELPPDAEIVFLGHTEEKQGKRTKHDGYFKTVWPRGLFAYMVTTEAARELLRYFEGIRGDLPIDEIIPSAINELGIVSYSCFPEKASTAGFVSVVNN